MGCALLSQPGNAGIALAFVCAARGYPLLLVMPETMSLERRALLLLLGAEIVLTQGGSGMKGAIAKAKELLESSSDFFVLNQLDNPSSPDIHRETTALEIWRDTDGQVDFVVTSIGTDGMATGIGEVLKAKKPSIKIVGIEPEEPAVISGEKPEPHKIQGIGAGFIPKNLNVNILDQVKKVTRSKSVEMARRLIKEKGIPAGISSGTAVVVALRIAAKEENRKKVIVTIIPSYIERYLSTVLAEKEREEAVHLPVSSVDEKYLS